MFVDGHRVSHVRGQICQLERWSLKVNILLVVVFQVGPWTILREQAFRACGRQSYLSPGPRQSLCLQLEVCQSFVLLVDTHGPQVRS